MSQARRDDTTNNALPLDPQWKSDWDHFELWGAHVELGPDGQWEVYEDGRDVGRDRRRLLRRGRAGNSAAARDEVRSRLPSMGHADPKAPPPKPTEAMLAPTQAELDAPALLAAAARKQKR